MNDGMYPQAQAVDAPEKCSNVKSQPQSKKNAKANVTMTNDKSFKSLLITATDYLTNDADLPEDISEDELENFESELYVSFVDRVTYTDEDGNTRTWLNFSDDGFIKPMRKNLPNLIKRQNEDTYIIINPSDKDNNSVLICEDFLKNHFYEIVNDPLLLFGSDNDITNFVIEYVRDKYVNAVNVFEKETFTFSELFSYLVDAHERSEALYYDDVDLYSNRKLGSGLLNLDVVHPFAQPPYMSVGIPVMFEINGELVLRTTRQIVPLLSEYTHEDTGIRQPSSKELNSRLNENKEYMANIERYQVYKGIGKTPGFMRTRDLYVSTRVMVDMGALYFVDPDRLNGLLNIINSNIEGANVNGNVKKRSSVYKDEEYLALSKSVVCYDLSKKQWFIGHRDNLNAINFRKDAFEKLQMDPTKKDIIRKICSSENVEKGNNIDFIDSKGGGNIFLLHGVPGTGKTLTAEAISELLERPLYKVNISEFDCLSELEQGIEMSLRYAERWNATLLIDEADVALEKRDSTNIERNAIVAVFLRLIEYYSGTMFLTSNRANEFDDAFKSRITFAIHYKSPDRKVKTAIWKNILDGVDNNITETQIAELADYEINGRQIKNVINTATFMSDDGSAKYDDVMVVLQQTIEFENFLKKE